MVFQIQKRNKNSHGTSSIVCQNHQILNLGAHTSPFGPQKSLNMLTIAPAPMPNEKNHPVQEDVGE